MRIPVMLTAITCLLGLTRLSHAETLASPAIFGSFAQEKAQCIIRNIRTTPISLAVTIFGESGEVVGGTSCFGPVEPGDNCSAFTPIDFGVAYACSATTPGSAKKLRGTLILFDEVDNGFGGTRDVPLRSAELR